MTTRDVQDKGLHRDSEFPLPTFSQSNMNGYGPGEVWEQELVRSNENGKSISADLYTVPLTCGQLCNEWCYSDKHPVCLS